MRLALAIVVAVACAAFAATAQSTPPPKVIVWTSSAGPVDQNGQPTNPGLP